MVPSERGCEMVRSRWLGLAAAVLLTQACAATMQSYDAVVPRPQPDVYSCVLQQVNMAGYTVQDANREAGFIRAEKQASGFFTEVLTGATFFDQLTVSVFEDVATKATRMRVTVSGIEESEVGLRRGARKAVSSSSSGKETGRAILRACGGGGTVGKQPLENQQDSPATDRVQAVEPKEPPPAAPTPQPETLEQVRITASAANVRSGAGTNQTVIVVLPRGTVLSVVRKEGSWFVVRLTSEFGTSAETGFIHTSTVEIVAAPTPSPAPAVRPEPQPERDPEPAPTPTRTPAATPTPRRVPQTQPVPAERNRFGGSLSWSDDVDFGIGARAELPVVNWHPRLRLVGSFEYFFPESQLGIDLSYFELNAGAAYSFPVNGNSGLQPYAGAGLGISRAKASAGGVNVSDSEIGLNLFAGSRFGNQFLGELRFRTGDTDHVILSAGVLF